MKYRATLLMLTAFLMLASDRQVTGEKAPKGERNSPAKTEAEKVARDYWVGQLSKCGDSYLGVLPPSPETPWAGAYIHEPEQLLGARFVAEARSLSEADRLNGLEWSGEFLVYGRSLRHIGDPKETWTGWYDVSRERPGPQGGYLGDWIVEAKKERGAWFVSYSKDTWYPIAKGSRFQKVPCDSLPPR